MAVLIALFVINLIIMSDMTVAVKGGWCHVPASLIDTWLIPSQNDTSIQLLEDSAIFKTDDHQRHFQCIDRKENIYLLQEDRPKLDGDEVGVVCILIAEMADSGYTLQRLNPGGGQNDIFRSQRIIGDNNLDIDNICRGVVVPDMIAIKRRQPMCSFPNGLLGQKKKSTFPSVSYVEVEEKKLTLHFQKFNRLELTCDMQDRHQFLLRWTLPNKKKDGIMCVDLLYVPAAKHFSLKILKQGTFMGGMMTFIDHLKPAHVHIDCNWQEFTYNTYFINP